MLFGLLVLFGLLCYLAFCAIWPFVLFGLLCYLALIWTFGGILLHFGLFGAFGLLVLFGSTYFALFGAINFINLELSFPICSENQF